jgi:hypothetical protein
MQTSQSCIARIAGGKVRPATEALERFAQATRTTCRSHLSRWFQLATLRRRDRTLCHVEAGV